MKKIIVAEGSPTIKSVADSLLRQNGYDVVCTSDGLQAWDVINADKPDLVLVGIGLSGISGIELCRQMSGDSLTGGIPVVVMTGSKDNINEEDLKSSGARGRLNKPFSPRDLMNVVIKLIGEGEQMGPEGTPKGDTSGITNYQAKVLSTTRNIDGSNKEVYNLDWTDLNDSDSGKMAASPKEDFISGEAEDLEIKIGGDQYDLASLNSGVDNQQQPGKLSDPKDEDYDWFIGEMKKEVENKPLVSKRKDTAASDDKKTPELIRPSGNDNFQFEDFGPSNSNVSDPDSEAINANNPMRQSGSEKSVVTRLELSDNDISKIADKVTQNLTAAIIAGIDRQKIIEAIKSVITR